MNNQSKQRVDDLDYTPNKVIIAAVVACLVGVTLWSLIPMVQGWLS